VGEGAAQGGVQVGDQLPRERGEIAAERAGVGDGELLATAIEEGVEGEAFPGAPAPVDRGFVHTGAPGDIGDAEPAGPVLGQGGEGGVEHRLADPGRAAPRAALDGGLGHRSES
jgi:hypothetical protein